MEKLVLRDDGINWIWYCHVAIIGESVVIEREYRLHKGDDDHPATVGEYSMIENSMDEARATQRMILGVRLRVNGQPFRELMLAEPVPRWTFTRGA